MMPRLRLLPLAAVAMGALFLVKAETLLGPRPAGPVAVAPARAADPPAVPPPVSAARLAATSVTAPPSIQPAAADPAAQAERMLLEQLRARRAEIEAREQAVAAQEVILEAAERRIALRVEELTALQQRLESLDRARTEREEAGWRGLVRTYEAMRPRDAAAIFNELDLPVLIGILDRMGERKAAPVIGAMRPDQARHVTAELARHRARRSAMD